MKGLVRGSLAEKVALGQRPEGGDEGVRRSQRTSGKVPGRRTAQLSKGLGVGRGQDQAWLVGASERGPVRLEQRDRGRGQREEGTARSCKGLVGCGEDSGSEPEGGGSAGGCGQKWAGPPVLTGAIWWPLRGGKGGEARTGPPGVLTGVLWRRRGENRLRPGRRERGSRRAGGASAGRKVGGDGEEGWWAQAVGQLRQHTRNIGNHIHDYDFSTSHIKKRNRNKRN